ncbi:cyanidin 3-O-rutinoside 5-O-glucosyltransferase-like [Panicum miliaceum]|uniref:Glycosyltransferase n=1 Tax=Panicum miliaceum TaxID=4540 RepID=A0A3L6T2W8_PANMI|nr:cyanidin 3-O-rutinoside 5-O-glucosyltransferase-like [Panicum miliaceum]
MATPIPSIRAHARDVEPVEPQDPSAMATKHHHHHFLIVTYPAQGHITPARHLARRLAGACPGARVTICAPLSAFRRMFPGAAAAAGEERGGDGDDAVAYVAYSDGYDGGFDSAADSYARYMERARAAGERSLAAVLRRLRGGGLPVTCAVYTLLLPWVAGVAREHGVAATAVFWIQPATALAAYYHYFRGHRDAVAAAAASGDPGAEVRLPGLPPLRFRDLPSFLAITDEDNPFAFVLPEFRELIDALERSDGSSNPPPTYVLANTFDALEHDALESLRPHVDVFAVGPVLSFLHETDDAKRTLSPPRDVFDHDRNGYLNWLDSKPAKSVVYISFGSSSVMSKKQVAKISDAMAQIKRPFLWVLRKDNCRDKEDDAAIKTLAAATGDAGTVVEWCDQARVLSHPSVACFVTHGGWNSTLEGVACGVPLVVAPQYSDQGTSAWLVAERAGAGVRAAAREADGVVEAAELARCVRAATSGAAASRAAAWREEARAAVAGGGGSDRSLTEFLRRIAGGGGNQY